MLAVNCDVAFSRRFSLTESEKCCLFCVFNIRAIAATRRTTMTNIMNGPTQLSVDGEIIVGLAAAVLVFEAGGDRLVELEVGALGFDICPLAARLFQVTLYPLA